MQARTPEEYSQELLQLYRQAQQQSPAFIVASSAPQPEIPSSKEAEPESMVPPESALEDITAPEPEMLQKPPDADAALPEAGVALETVPEPELSSPLAEQTARGWLQVITRSAGNARALAGVAVRVTSEQKGQQALEYATITNESGETEKIELPVPEASLSLDQNELRQPYSTYDVSVYANGYYRMTSENVPVFAGITSRQIFSLIPLPSYPLEEPNSIVFRNTEPDSDAI